jgi:subtilisin family serine protease
MRLRRSVTALSVLAILAAFTALPTPPAYADSTTDTYIVQLKAGVSADKMAKKLMGGGAEVVHKVFQGGIVKLNAAQANALASSPYVKSVHKDAVIHAADTQLNAPWDLDMLDSSTGSLDNSYTYPNNGSGVTVYVLDSGIQRSHVEFSGGNISAGYNFVESNNDTTDCKGHGTAVSSLIDGATLGVAKGVTLVPLRVLDCFGSGSDANVIRAAEWIAQNRTPGAPAVANLSLGVAGADVAMEAALQGLIDARVTVVAAAGNGDINGNGLDACTQSPARLPGAITVAAVDRLHAEPKWTNYGSCVDLYAPGVNDYVALIGTSNTGIGFGSGTSFSAPLVSAAAAQALHDYPTWTPAQVRADLVDRAVAGVITAPGGLPAGSPNLLLNVSTQFSGSDPTITGSTYVGATLQASLHWTPTPATATYQWSRNGVAIDGATGASYVTTSDDLGQSIAVTVTGSRPRLPDITGTSTAVVPTEAPHPGMVVSLTPSRLLDTRNGTGPLRNGQTVRIPVAGVGDIKSTASAVLVNITVTDATTEGFVTAYASGGAMPATSNGNFQVGKVSATLALVPVGSDGAIALSVRLGGTVQLVVDVQSYIAGGVVTDAGAVVPVTPTRLWDSRDHAAVGPFHVLTVQATGVSRVPADATAVFVNVTVTEPQTGGYLAVYPSGDPIPATSNLNFVKNLTVPNLALVKVGGDGTISIQNAGPGTAQVVVDLQGYITAGTPTEQGAVVPVSPVRIVDTRIGLGVSGPVAASTGAVVTVTGSAVPTGVQGVFMNLTVTETQAPGWLAAYATQATRPLVSNLNFEAGQTVPNLATVGLSDGLATVYNGSLNRGTVQMVIDVFAYIL